MSPSELLEERISDVVTSLAKHKGKETIMWDVAIIAFRAVAVAAIGGNVTCKTALAEILALCHKKQ